MKINELLDSKIEQTIVVDSANSYSTKATIGNRMIHFSAEKDSKNNSWKVLFYQTNLSGSGKSMKFNATGSGDEFAVFSMVKDAITELVQKRNPKEIHFSAVKKEDSRSGLYDRLIKRFKMPNYEYEKEPGEDEDTFFLIRKD